MQTLESLSQQALGINLITLVAVVSLTTLTTLVDLIPLSYTIILTTLGIAYT